MSIATPVRRRPRAVDVADGLFFAFSGVASVWFAFVLARDGARGGWQTLLLVVFWIFAAYLALPRLHRILTGIYVPGYFIGRTRTSDGLLGDPVNLGFLGDDLELHRAFEDAGWSRADDLGVDSSWRIATSVIRRRSYPTAPVSPLHLFDRQQDFAYQREVAGSPLKRHHIRLWRCPEDWLLPGGFPVEWLGAASFDRRVGLSLFTLQITHRIDANIDDERDFVVGSLTAADPGVTVRTIDRFASGYHSRNGGGDRILTDGDLPIVDLGGDGDAAAHDLHDSRDRRPATITVGAGLASLRACWYLTVAALLVFAPRLLDAVGEGAVTTVTSTSGVATVASVLLVLASIDLVLAAGVHAGRVWARLGLMTTCAFSVWLTFLTTRGGAPVGVGELPTLGGGLLVLLALSSHRSREWSLRRSGRADV